VAFAGGMQMFFNIIRVITGNTDKRDVSAGLSQGIFYGMSIDITDLSWFWLLINGNYLPLINSQTQDKSVISIDTP